MEQSQVNEIVKVLKEFAAGESNVIDFTSSVTKQNKELICLDEKTHHINWSIHKSQKYIGKLSLNCYLKEAQRNILRLDTDPLNQHTNPTFTKDKTPAWLKPYASLNLREQTHMHIYVEGYEQLDWVMPLSEIGTFNVQKIENMDDIVEIVKQFADYIQLKSKMSFNKPIL